MRYYYKLDQFYEAVRERAEKGIVKKVPVLYRANARLDKDYEENEMSNLWLLEKVYGADKGSVDFDTYEEAQRALADNFYEAVADELLGW